MFITEEQLSQRLSNPKNLANRFKNGRVIHENEVPQTQEIAQISENQDLHQEGIQSRAITKSGNNRPWLTKSERTRIAADYAASTGNFNKVGQKEIAAKYGVAISTVSDIVNGRRRIESARSVDAHAVEAVKTDVDKELDKVREAAIERLMSGLNQLTDDKISAHNAKDISTVCSNMARVVQQTIPQEKGAQAINLIVYTPEIRSEKQYDVIEVGE